LTSKLFRSCYFVLYDENDDVVCYLEDVNELLSLINTNRINNIVSRLVKNNHNFTNVTIKDKEYKLYVFC